MLLFSSLTSQVACCGERVNPVSNLNHEQTQTGLLLALKVLWQRLPEKIDIFSSNTSVIYKYRNSRDAVGLESRADSEAAQHLTSCFHTEASLSLTLVDHISL